MVSEYLDRAAKRQKTDGDLLTTDAGGNGGERKDVAVGGMVAATAAAVDEEALCGMKDVGSVPQVCVCFSFLRLLLLLMSF